MKKFRTKFIHEIQELREQIQMCTQYNLYIMQYIVYGYRDGYINTILEIAFDAYKNIVRRFSSTNGIDKYIL